MFNTETQEKWGKWYINRYANYSVEALRFIQETVLFNKDLRLEATQLIEHDYFKSDLASLGTIAQTVDQFRNIACKETPIEIDGIFQQTDDIPRFAKLWFDSRNPENFMQFYRHMTGNESYSISVGSSIPQVEEASNLEEVKSISGTLT